MDKGAAGGGDDIPNWVLQGHGAFFYSDEIENSLSSHRTTFEAISPLSRGMWPSALKVDGL
jgi:hypothetical protein